MRYMLRAELCTGSTTLIGCSLRCVVSRQSCCEKRTLGGSTLSFWLSVHEKREENEHSDLKRSAAASADTRCSGGCADKDKSQAPEFLCDPYLTASKKKIKVKVNKFIIACLFVYSTNTREPKCLCCLVCEKAPYVSSSLAKKGKRKEKIKTLSPAYDLSSPVALVCVNISLPACAMELSKTIKVAQSVSLKDRQTEEMKRNQTETSCIAMEMMYRGHTEGFLQTIHPSIHQDHVSAGVLSLLPSGEAGVTTADKTPVPCRTVQSYTTSCTPTDTPELVNLQVF